MDSSRTRVTGTHVTTFFLATALAAALAGCGGGGGGSPVALPTGSSVTAQAATPVIEDFAGPAAFRLNPTGSAPVQLQAMGTTGDGGTTLVWQEPAGSRNGTVRWRHVDAQGMAGAEAAVTAPDLQTAMAAAVLPSGQVVLASLVTGPATAEEPWITRTSITVQRRAADGAATGAALEIAAVAQDRIGATAMRYLAQPTAIRWDDGSFAVAWLLIVDGAGGALPQVWLQRFDADGQAIGTPRAVATGDAETAYRITAVPGGGAIVTTFHGLGGRTVQRFHAVDGAVAPVLPAGAPGVAQDSVLLPLADGRLVLLSPVQSAAAVQVYAADGQPLGPAGSLPSMPVAATALRGGGYMAVAMTGGRRQAQRFDASGARIGNAVDVAAASSGTQAAATPDGGAMLGWTAAAGSAELMAQRVRP